MAALYGLLVLAVLFGLGYGVACIIDRVRDRKIYGNAVVMDDGEIVRPAQTIDVILKDCKVVSKSEYSEPPQSRRFERYDAALGMGGDPASKRICTAVSSLEYETTYKGSPVKFVSALILLDEITLRMRMFDHKTTTIDIYENGQGRITDFDFDLEFLYEKR